MNIDILGPVFVLGISAMGSCIGCGIAGMASHAVMARVDEGHGKLIGMSAMPASQMIYGFILMLLMNAAIKEGSISAQEGVAMGISCGLAFLMSSVMQGKCCATGIQASGKQPAIYGKCFAAIGIVESFALFVFVFALLLF